MQAKRYAFVNILSNALVVFVSAVINIWLTRYLVQKLGVEVYGMFPFAMSVVLYFSVVSLSLTDSISRFVAISLNQGRIARANTFFSTALISLLVMSFVLLVPLILFALYLPVIFNVPSGFELDASLLLFAIVSGSFLLAIHSPFTIGVFVRHRFYLTSAIKIAGKLIWIASIVLGFIYLSQSLWVVGFSYISMNAFVLVSHIYLSRKLLPELHFNPLNFEWRCLHEISMLSIWILINQLGALLYLNISFILINLFLGSSAVSFFSPFVLWINLLSSLAATMTQIYVPVAFEYIAKQRNNILAKQTTRAIKLIVLVMGLPVAILCGLSQPILTVWLDESFGSYWPLAWLLVLPWVVNMIARPIYSIFRGFNKLKVPALVTIIVGALNVVLSIVLLATTNWGIYAVAVSLLICWTGKNIFFTPVYAAKLLNIRARVFIKALVPGFVFASLFGFALLVVSRYIYLETFCRLSIVSLVCFVCYGFLAFSVILTADDRNFIKEIITRKVADG